MNRQRVTNLLFFCPCLIEAFLVHSLVAAASWGVFQYVRTLQHAFNIKVVCSIALHERYPTATEMLASNPS